MPEQKTVEISFSGIDKQNESQIAPTDINSQTNQDFINSKFMEMLALRKPVSVVPTYIPKNFIEQTVYYVSGATVRRYDFINGTWRYTTLT